MLARRPDGFHEIESLMVPVTLHDTLPVRGRGSTDPDSCGSRCGLAAVGHGPRPLPLRRDVPTDESNLVVRAARLLAAEAG